MPPRDNPINRLMNAAREILAPELSIEEHARLIAAERAAALATRAEAAVAETESVETARHPLSGGAFGGALKRWVEATDSIARREATNDRDIALLEPSNLRHELMRTRDGDQVYKFQYGRGHSEVVLLTPHEHTALTFSPKKLAGRVGNRVLEGTVARPATERHARKAEVTQASLVSQYNKSGEQLVKLAHDETVLTRLLKEMGNPGFSHMRQEEMDALMLHARGVFIEMFEAITTNHGVGTERVESLSAALDYLLTASDEKGDYHKTFDYWRAMSRLGQHWTRRKLRAFQNVHGRIAKEYEDRFHRQLVVA